MIFYPQIIMYESVFSIHHWKVLNKKIIMRQKSALIESGRASWSFTVKSHLRRKRQPEKTRPVNFLKLQNNHISFINARIDTKYFKATQNFHNFHNNSSCFSNVINTPQQFQKLQNNPRSSKVLSDLRNCYSSITNRPNIN
jgi:hypothetical protein